jgi:ABC-type phosphate transport system permease subunit
MHDLVTTLWNIFLSVIIIMLLGVVAAVFIATIGFFFSVGWHLVQV